MTRKSIEEQIESIRETGERVSASPEAARDFLERAGIIAPKNDAIRERSSVYSPKSDKWVSRSDKTGQFVAKKQKK